MAAYLQSLKETFVNPGEILRLEWRDIKDNVLTINHPVKGHLPGQIQISPRLVAMLNRLPKQEKRIFPITYQTARNIFNRIRQRQPANFRTPAS
jgi:integrase